MAARPKSVRHAADPADRDNKSDQTGKQQPGTALDRRQDADSENGAHSDPNRESTKQFHGGYVTRLGRRFKPSLFSQPVKGGVAGSRAHIDGPSAYDWIRSTSHESPIGR